MRMFPITSLFANMSPAICSKNLDINTEDGINESVIGTAFYRLGEAGHDDCVMFREIALDVIDNEIDTLTKTFKG